MEGSATAQVDPGEKPTRPTTPVKTPRRKRRVWRGVGITLLVLLLVGIAARLALPGYLQRYVNGVLDQNPHYDGRVGEIDVHLWRGAYSIVDVKIVKTTHAIPVPFFESRKVEFTLDWHSLFQGSARGQIIMHSPKLNFVRGPSEEQTQTGAGEDWLAMIDELYPFRIDQAEIRNGEIHFRAFHTEPVVDIYLSEVQAVAENLTNVDDKLDPLLATARARALAMNSGRFELDMKLDPNSHHPTFDLATRIIDLDVTNLNALTRAYGKFDFKKGRFDLVIDLKTKDGFMEGYAKPLFRDLEVLSLDDVRQQPLGVIWEGLVALVSEVFKNQPRDQFGTMLTLEGDLRDPQTSLLEIIGNVLHNAFIEAYRPQFERRSSKDS